MGEVVTVDIDDLTPGQMIQINGKGGSDLYQFLELYPNGTATLEWLFTCPRGDNSCGCHGCFITSLSDV